MNKWRICLVSMMLMIILFLQPANALSGASIEKRTLEEGKRKKIETYIKKYKEKGGIPGMSVAVVTQDGTYIDCFGYENIASKEKVSTDTKFELASNSKAFTAIGILQLQEEGKLAVEDSIYQYIPEISFYYNQKKADVTIEQFMHHTSGIPFETIEKIPVDSSDHALKNTVQMLQHIKLKHKPGKQFEYATVNYDVLGYLIERITGLTFEEYMKFHVFQPLGLMNTFCLNDKEGYDHIAQGYMVNMGKAIAYHTPDYRGDTPAGYMFSSITDISRWLEIQLGLCEDSQISQKIMEQSHEADRKVPASGDGASYAGGWESYQNGLGEYKHNGSNQYFSSCMIVQTEAKVAIAVLGNMNSEYTSFIAEGISEIIEKGNASASFKTDTNKVLDRLAMFLLLLDVCLAVFILYVCMKHKKKQAGHLCSRKNSFKTYFLMLCIFAGILIGIYRMPNVLGGGLSWQFVFLWLPYSIKIALYAGCAMTVVVFFFSMAMLYLGRTFLDVMVPVMLFSIISGGGNALIIFAVNMSIGQEGSEKIRYVMYLLIGLLMYAGGQKIVRSHLIVLANDMIYQKRKQLIHKFLGTAYEEIETNVSKKFHVVLNNDTETVSNFVNVLISAITSFVTVTFCGIYLYFLNRYALLLAIIIILLIGMIYFFFGQYANRMNESARTIQNVFFRFIEDLCYGIKELLINEEKKREFEKEMNSVCEGYKNKRIQAAEVYANLFIIGELLFTIAVAIIAFVFPFVVTNLRNEELSGYVFVLLYMIGPVNSLLDAIPELMNINISWKRIKELLNSFAANENELCQKETISELVLQLEDVRYEYGKEDNRNFVLGPVNGKFHSGQITFITGGNGSGKSTFAKIIAGLYQRTSGTIKINGRTVWAKELGNYFTTVFSDFHLFECLYGIDCEKNADKIKEYLELLGLSHKVQVVNGHFTTIDLSTGQKKRLALLISLLEDKEIYLFDEWAADQDPVFREFFYTNVLQMLKERGKCIIAITHDDKYFGLADQKIKFELGKILEE